MLKRLIVVLVVGDNSGFSWLPLCVSPFSSGGCAFCAVSCLPLNMLQQPTMTVT
jgi:hypothetical protein